MVLPDNFNEFEHPQDLIRLEHNKAVQAYFKNQEDDDISTPKASLKHACLIKDEDTAAMTQMRLWLFEITCGHAQALQRPVYGVPWYEIQSERTFKPQVKLYFLEPYNGRTVQKFTRRRTVDVKFSFAQLLIWGKQNPINLVATSGSRLKSVIERV